MPNNPVPVTAGGALSPGDRRTSASSGGPPIARSATTDTTPPDDERLAAFAALLDAVDRSEAPAMLTATRKLRRLGFSVVVIRTPNGGGVPWR